MKVTPFENDCGLYFSGTALKIPCERWEVRRLVDEMQRHINRWDKKQAHALPEPMREEPEPRSKIFIVDLVGNEITETIWVIHYRQKLNAGLCHTSRESAQVWLYWWNEAVGRKA